MTTQPSNFHESYHAREEVEGGTNRAFGLTIGSILLAIGLYRWLSGNIDMSWLTFALLAFGVILLILGLLAAHFLDPLNYAWTKLGLVLFKIVSPVAMFLIYALGVVPVGLLMRARRYDALRLKRPLAPVSYWIERQPPGPAPRTMTDQF